MNELKNDALLEKLFQYARTIGGDDMPLTSARFLLAALAALDGGVDVGGADLTALRTAINGATTEPAKLKAALQAHVDKNGSSSYFESLYMQKLVMEARTKAAEAGAGSLTAEAVVATILAAPDSKVKEILMGSGATAQTGSESIIPEDIIASFRQLVTGEDKTESNSATPAGGATPMPSATASAAEKAEAAPQQDVPLNIGDVAALTGRTKEIHATLSDVVFGQENAISTFVNGYFRSEMLRMTDPDRKRPATFLFAGPPGVGKTFLAEQIASVLDLPFARFDMSEYSGHEAIVEFIGSDDVYRGAKEGNVTTFVKQHPRSVLLFDEVEKAHTKVIYLFLQMLDAGILRDSKSDNEINFKDTILIFTTNAGRQLYEDSETTDFSGLSQKVILRALQKDVDPRTGEPFFPAAICSRFASGNVVMFNHITANNLIGIAKREVLRHAENFEKKFGISVELDDMVYTTMLLGEGGAADARMVRGRAESFFNAELHELMRLMSEDAARTIKKLKIDVQLPEDDPQVLQLFRYEERPTALLFAKPDAVPWCIGNAACDFVVTDSLTEAVTLMREKDIAFAAVDILCGLKDNTYGYLNIEDVDSDGRKLLQFIHSQYNAVPVYMARGERPYTPEERVSFTRQGVRGEVVLNAESGEFLEQVAAITESIHQQRCMGLLAKANKVVSYSTSQSVDGETAYIHLFDLRLTVAVDAEDSSSILSNMSRPNIKFDEVIGAEEAKKELLFFVDYLKNPKKFIGNQPPKGVILYGPPGTGKTMLAKAMASESDVTFLTATGSQFRKQYIGQGGDAIRNLFRTARKYAPSILFIDEIDAIAQERRGDDGNGGTRETSATLTALLTEMDGFRKDTTKPVFVLAATNFDVEPGSPRSLDAALMRRFDRRIMVDLPNRNERLRYLKERTSKNEAYQISEEKFESIAIRSTGLSLALLESVMELALRMAIREGLNKVTDDIFDEAFETFTNGERKDWGIETLERVARHEAGHAFLYWYHGKTPSYLTVVARGSHGGYMQHDDPEKQPLKTKADELAAVCTSLGGRAAELVYYGEDAGLSTGPSGDLISATRTAQNILCHYGMDEEFGMAVVDPKGPMAEKVHDKVNCILKEQLEKAVQLISAHREKFDKLVTVLMDKNHLTGDEIEAILRD